MKHLIIASLLLGATVSASAEVWTLDSCVNYAVSHNLSVKSAQLDLEKAHQSVVEAKSRFLPTLSAGAAQNWDFGRGLTAQNTYANRNTSSFGWNAQFSLPVFQGLSALRTLRQAQAAVPVSETRVRAAREEVTLGVLAYYLQALYTRSMVDVARENLALSEAQHARTLVLVEGGKVAEIEALQAQSEVEQNRLQLVQAEGDASLALVDLAQALQLPSAEGFQVDTLLSLPPDGNVPSVADIYASALGTNASIKAAAGQVELARHAVSVAQSGYLPRLNFNAGLGSTYYTLSGSDNPGFSRQMRDNFSRSLGFSISVPIFDAFNTRNQVRQARMQVRQADLELERQRTQLYKSVEQAWQQTVNASASWQAACRATEAARAALDAMNEKYAYGRATLTETTEARTNYANALARLTQARYEHILRARILGFYADPSSILR
ncbi:MAG: TolC family protein [Duncaniella sp.]|nr:TolC family protein [Duncaniella sp.]